MVAHAQFRSEHGPLVSRTHGQTLRVKENAKFAPRCSLLHLSPPSYPTGHPVSAHAERGSKIIVVIRERSVLCCKYIGILESAGNSGAVARFSSQQ